MDDRPEEQHSLFNTEQKELCRRLVFSCNRMRLFIYTSRMHMCNESKQYLDQSNTYFEVMSQTPATYGAYGILLQLKLPNDT